MGGDNRSENFKVWDIRQSAAGLWPPFLFSLID
jgi:hypothetical protein